MMAAINEDFYPVTDRVDWGPLEKLLSDDLVGEFMFMQADTDGRRYYKHFATRHYVFLNDRGEAWNHDGLPAPAYEAVRAALGKEND